MITIKYDNDVKIWVAHCSEHNVYSQGTTYKEAELAIKDAVESYLTVKERRGIA